MNLIELIFALLAKFVPLDSVKLLSLQKDGKLWYDEINPEAEGTLPFIAKLKQYGEMWYTQVGFAIAFIFLQRLIFDFLNPTPSQDDEDDE